MQIVLNSNRVAVFFGDVGPIRLEADGCYFGPYFNSSHTSNNCELIDVTPPEFLLGNCYAYTGEAWVVVDEDSVARYRQMVQEKKHAEISEARRAAYAKEADPIFFKYQRGEATKDAWLEKISEIRRKFPFNEPTENTGLIPVAEFT